MKALRQAAVLAAGAAVAGTLTACTHHAVPCGNGYMSCVSPGPVSFRTSSASALFSPYDSLFEDLQSSLSSGVGPLTWKSSMIPIYQRGTANCTIQSPARTGRSGATPGLTGQHQREKEIVNAVLARHGFPTATDTSAPAALFLESENAAGATFGFRSDDEASAWITVPRPYDECPR